MRRAARVDRNQKEIVKALRKLGASVCCTHALGNGFPDIVVGFKGVNYLLEIKDGKKPPSQCVLTPDEDQFHTLWRGDIGIVYNVADCYRLLGFKSI